MRFSVQKMRLVLLFALAMAVPLDFRIGGGVSGVVSISTSEAVTIFCVISYLALLLTGRLSVTRSVIRSVTPYVAYIALASLLTLVSNNSEMVAVWRAVVMASLLLWIVISWVDTEVACKRVLWGFLSGVAVNCAFGLAQIVFGGPRPISLEAHGSNLKEGYFGTVASDIATGLFPHPNAFAIFLVVAILITGGWLSAKARDRYDPLILALLALFLTNLYFTFGKGAAMWLLVAGIIMAASRTGLIRKHFLTIIMAIVAAILFLLFYLLPDLRAEGGGGTLMTRLILVEVLIDVLKQDPIGLVLGANSARMYNLSGVYSTFQYANSHNTWLNQVVYFGLGGLILFVIYTTSALKRLTDILDRRSRSISWIPLVVCCCLTALYGYAFFEPMLQGAASLGLFALLTGIAASQWSAALRRPHLS